MAIEQRTLTTGEVEGSGVFDELMRTVKSHVHAELKDGRINGENYTQVYLGSMQSAMQTALQMTLQMEMVNKQLLILDEQVLQGEKQNELLELQKEQLRIANATAQYNLDTILPQQSLLLTNQIAQVAGQTLLVGQQTLQATAQVALTGKQEALVDEQIASAKDEHTLPTAGINLMKYNKLEAEIGVLTQKKLTETAQTVGGFIGDEAGGTIGGLVGAELFLKKTQKDSFLRDAEQKAAKMYTDVFATMYATDPNDLFAAPENYGFDITTARDVMDQMLTGVGATRSTTDVIGDGVSVPTTGPSGGPFVPITYPREIEE